MKFLPAYLLLLCTMLSTESCHRRDLFYEDPNIEYANIKIELDWSKSMLHPEYATVLFYKEGASKPMIFYMTKTTEIVKLPEGRYSIIVFNEKPGDFDALDFREMDNYSTIQAFAKPMSMRGYVPTTGAIPIQAPDILAISSMDRFDVTKSMVSATINGMQQRSPGVEKSVVKTLKFIPEVAVINTEVLVHIQGINNIRQETSNASVSGFAESIFLCSRKQTTIPGVCQVKLTTFLLDEGSTTTGTVSGRLNIFGFCNRGEGDKQTVMFTYDAILRDAEKTPYTVTRNITSFVDQKPDTSVELVIEVGVDAGEDDDNPIVVVPDVKPEDSGFIPEIPDWGDEEVVDKIL